MIDIRKGLAFNSDDEVMIGRYIRGLLVVVYTYNGVSWSDVLAVGGYVEDILHTLYDSGHLEYRNTLYNIYAKRKSSSIITLSAYLIGARNE